MKTRHSHDTTFRAELSYENVSGGVVFSIYYRVFSNNWCTHVYWSKVCVAAVVVGSERAHSARSLPTHLFVFNFLGCMCLAYFSHQQWPTVLKQCANYSVVDNFRNVHVIEIFWYNLPDGLYRENKMLDEDDSSESLSVHYSSTGSSPSTAMKSTKSAPTLPLLSSQETLSSPRTPQKFNSSNQNERAPLRRSNTENPTSVSYFNNTRLIKSVFIGSFCAELCWMWVEANANMGRQTKI